MTTHHLKMQEGASFDRTLTHYEAGAAVDLTTYSAAFKISASRFGSVWVTIDEEDDTAGSITLDASGGVRLELTGSQTDALVSSVIGLQSTPTDTDENGSTRLYYIIELTSAAGFITRAFEGALIVDRRME